MRLSFPHPLLVWSGRVESTGGIEGVNEVPYITDTRFRVKNDRNLISAFPRDMVTPPRWSSSRVKHALWDLEHSTRLTAIVRACIALGEEWGTSLY